MKLRCLILRQRSACGPDALQGLDSEGKHVDRLHLRRLRAPVSRSAAAADQLIAGRRDGDGDAQEPATAGEIKTLIDQYVISQEKPKKIVLRSPFTITTNALMHNAITRISSWKRANPADRTDRSGKTPSRRPGKILEVPSPSPDATTLTQAGYVGEDVENILLRLLQNAGGDKEKASAGNHLH